MGCTVDTTSLAGFILELVLMVRRLVFTCVVNDRRPSFQCTPLATTSGPAFTQLQQHCNQLAGFVNSFQVVKVSEAGCQEKAPMHQPSFSRTMRTTLASWLGARHPGFTSRTILSGNRLEKSWSLAPPLRCNKMISTPAWLCVRSSLSAIAPDLQEQVETTKPHCDWRNGSC